jgi:hypothetical protein
MVVMFLASLTIRLKNHKIRHFIIKYKEQIIVKIL